MKKIVLIPTKNEEWIIEYTISTLHPYVDHILISDQHSSDSTRKLCSAYSKVSVIDNNETGHSNKVRWQLLEEARKIDGEHLLFCIDADEIVRPEHISNIEAEAKRLGPGTVFVLPWIQLWNDCQHYRVDGVWKNNLKPTAFYDDRKMQYTQEVVLNDHTSRVPTEGVLYTQTLNSIPLFHFHFLAKDRIRIKQAWYRCSELINAPKRARYINNTYSVSDNTASVQSVNVPQEWLLGAHTPRMSIFDSKDTRRLEQIQEWFDTYGILFFEDVDIWDIDILYKQFKEKVGREPRPKKFPSWIIKANTIKNKLLSYIRKK